MRRPAVVILALLMGCAPTPPTVQKTPENKAPAAQNQAMEEVRAKVGVGIKGRSLDPHQGPLVTPAKALFATKEKVVFEIQIPHALNLYNASEGNFPKSHEEFMEKIVAANNLVLPQLPDGHTYIYDPESHELKVRRPATAADGTAPKAP